MFGTRMQVMHEQQEAVYYYYFVDNILFFALIIIYFVFFQIRTYNDNIRKQMHSKKCERQKH